MTRYRHLAGHTPWQASPSPEVEPQHPVAQQDAAYTCDRGHSFTVTFAAGASPPPFWDHVCGARARLDGTTGTAPAGRITPAYGSQFEGLRKDPITHRQYVLERRSVDHLEALLNERLAVIRGQS